MMDGGSDTGIRAGDQTAFGFPRPPSDQCAAAAPERERTSVSCAQRAAATPAGGQPMRAARLSISSWAAGRTDRKIGEVRFLGEKTVEAHLSRVFRKLGVRSRSQVAARMAARRGEPPG